MDSNQRAVTAWHSWRTPGAILRVLRDSDRAAVDAEWERMAPEVQSRLASIANELSDAGVNAWLFGDEDYPHALAQLKSPPPVVFYGGNKALLERRAIGVCGSRAASAEGLEAARALALSVAQNGQVTIAGNALGVDAEAQGSALEAGGGVITVLPEGISHFRLRTRNTDTDYPEEQLLVISQFPPSQPWSIGGAMSRNALIVAIATVLVVIEAADRGGTLAAGEAALRMGRPVIALEFDSGTPAGNVALIRKGARAAKTPRELSARLEEATVLDSSPAKSHPEQLPLTI